MLKPLLASAALGALIATGALAQNEAPAADPAPGTTAPAPETMAPAEPAPLTGDWVTDENFTPVEVAQLTADQIIGADIRSSEGEVIASVEDVVLGADGKAESVAAKFGGFLGFGSNTVLLALDEVEFMQNDSGRVVLRTSLTPEALEGRPDYVKS
ncbi:PRC-barrel domain-containing protein [Amaricoccus sp.]|uniref:PRC-barrel domain-containing protein n=1 Tax=Amaricoccus sp. TaxID=1872485 RepID=UPI00260B629D|nr:PRC-barrel domain-containing protein [Amaricoccus sp.]HRO10167.1 PRC-barrel domain-containing protein [Amaricoccus sp.]